MLAMRDTCFNAWALMLIMQAACSLGDLASAAL